MVCHHVTLRTSAESPPVYEERCFAYTARAKGHLLAYRIADSLLARPGCGGKVTELRVALDAPNILGVKS